MKQQGGMTPQEARRQLDHQQRDIPGPYLFLGFGELDGAPLMARAEWLDAPMQPTLEAVYREFRRRMSKGRLAIWVGCDLHPKTLRPQQIIALDSQLCDKAFVTPAAP